LLFTAYLDESDTHGREPHMIVAGFLGSVRQWELVGRKLRALGSRYGFTVLHARKFRSGSGEFRGWSREKSMRLVNEVGTVIRDGLTEGVLIILPRSLYETEYRAAPISKHMPLDSQYGVCFRICLLRLIEVVTADRKTHRLNVVIEDGHKNVLDTRRIFNEVKAELDVNGTRLLGTISITKKDKSPPLMLADFLAHTGYLSEARVRAHRPGYFEMTQEQPRRREAGLMQIEITAETIDQIKEAWRRAWWQRKRRKSATREARRAMLPGT
jgi:hypothetical protein